MSGLDWIVVALPLGMLLWVALFSRRYVKSVADFLSAGRLARRYLLAVAKGEQSVGAAVFVAMFEVVSKSGFILTWWAWLTTPLVLIVTISGWVIYRFRETRALTLAQFFEMRYSKSFRIFAGILGFAAGMANFGIIPAVGARFLAYMLGIPPTVTVFGHEVPSYVLLMALLLTMTVVLTLSGGLITIIITNCLEGMISQVLFLVIIFALVWMFRWSQVSTVLLERPAGKSMVDPFDAFQVSDFNLWFALMGVWWNIYRTMAWQNQGAYNSAALNAHESRMGGVMSTWRGMGNTVVMTLLAVCAMTFLANPDFSSASATAKAAIAHIPAGQIQEQMSIPIAVEHMLPVGVKGALCVVLLMGVFGGDGAHLLSWGSIFIQDVILPFRRTPFSPEEHVRLLRRSIVGVAIFVFIFGSLFQQTEYVQMWWGVTEALFVGGAGVAIIGGLYWKRGTTTGAWAGMITGSTLVTGGIIARQIWVDAFPLNGTWIGFVGSLTACTVYAVTSWLTCREPFDLDRMLHRGKYAVEREPRPQESRRLSWSRLIGFDEHFSRGDKWLAGGIFGWSALWLSVLLIGTAWNIISPWPATAWAAFWGVVGIGLPIIIATVNAFWFTWGGVRDMRELFRRLDMEKVNALDNGMVVDHTNLGENAPSNRTSHPARPI